MAMRHGDHAAGLLTFAEFGRYWPDIEGMLDAVPHTWDGLTKEQIICSVRDGSMQAWGIEEGDTVTMILLTRVAIGNGGKRLRVIWAAGEGSIKEKIAVLDKTLDFFAQTQDCVMLDVVGREGWDRMLRPLGFKRSSITLSRPVAVYRGMQQ